jgi:integrase
MARSVDTSGVLGFKSVSLPGTPDSAEYKEAYQAALTGKTAPKRQIGAKRLVPGTVDAAIDGYLKSNRFRKLAAITQCTYANVLKRFCREHGKKHIAALQPAHIEALVAAQWDTPGSCRNFIKALRSLMKYCIKAKLRSNDPTREVELPNIIGDGFYTWTEDDIAAYRTVHPIGSKKRLAMELPRYTALRRSDLVRIGPDDVKDGILTVRPQKTEGTTGVTLFTPIHPDLARVLAATPCEPGTTFFETAYGKQRTPDGFGNWFREACEEAREAGLHEKASVHGLRKAACCALAERGCTAKQIMAISGIKSLAVVQKYIEKADQKRLAKAGMDKWVAADLRP